MDALNERLTVAEGEIKTVEVQLAAVERKLDEPGADIAYLRKKEDQLIEEKRQLREEKRLILEHILRQSPGK
jgi:septal ring factor EnvC (AmiA/AmiB activator)